MDGPGERSFLWWGFLRICKNFGLQEGPDKLPSDRKVDKVFFLCLIL